MWACHRLLFVFSLSRKRDASVALELETKMNIEGPPVKAVPEASAA